MNSPPKTGAERWREPCELRGAWGSLPCPPCPAAMGQLRVSRDIGERRHRSTQTPAIGMGFTKPSLVFLRVYLLRCSGTRSIVLLTCSCKVIVNKSITGIKEEDFSQCK